MMGRTVYFDSNGNEIEPPKADPVPITNADRIRSMTDEELAEFLTSEHFVDVPWCLRWLKSPSDKEEKR